MCVAFPGRVVSIEGDDVAVVEIFGVKKRVFTDLLSEKIEVGDFVLSHAGFAIQKVDREEAEKTLNLVKEMLDD